MLPPFSCGVDDDGNQSLDDAALAGHGHAPTFVGGAVVVGGGGRGRREVRCVRCAFLLAETGDDAGGHFFALRRWHVIEMDPKRAACDPRRPRSRSLLNCASSLGSEPLLQKRVTFCVCVGPSPRDNMETGCCCSWTKGGGAYCSCCSQWSQLSTAADIVCCWSCCGGSSNPEFLAAGDTGGRGLRQRLLGMHTVGCLLLQLEERGFGVIGGGGHCCGCCGDGTTLAACCCSNCLLLKRLWRRLARRHQSSGCWWYGGGCQLLQRGGPTAVE